MMLGTAEIAEYLNTSQRCARRMMQHGVLSGVREQDLARGNSLHRIEAAELRLWVDKRKVVVGA